MLSYEYHVLNLIFAHVRVDVNMCLMCKDYRFYVLLLFYAIDVRAGLEIFFIFDIFLLRCCIIKFLSACFYQTGPHGRTVPTEWYTLYKYIGKKNKCVPHT